VHDKRIPFQKGGTKKYERVLERIGRLRERYPSIAHYYKIDVRQKYGIGTEIDWKFDKAEKAKQRFSGTYFLPPGRTDLNEKDI
jgi:hypothetical protein